MATSPLTDLTCRACGSAKLSVNYSAAPVPRRGALGGIVPAKLRVALICPRCDLLKSAT